MTITVDLMDSAGFMTYKNGELRVEDLSSADLPSGTTQIKVTLTDGLNVQISNVQVIIYKAPVYESATVVAEQD